MNPEENFELHKIIIEWMLSKGKASEDAIYFLSTAWVAQMCLDGHSEKFVDETLALMKKSWIDNPFK